ncbi:MAG: type II toxin-antitoxin system PemK/MazF family toxin [Gammaproteobacteria bacterium]|nr:type II toxin-antitoxin system PemK/MazF family toxin [Gammaproteobacteria bacterium]
MVEILTRGGVYLARLDPVKHNEVGKIRPIVVLTSQRILDAGVSLLFVCPLSSQSHPKFSHLHVEIPIRDQLQVVSYALVEHCRSITVQRLVQPRIAQLTPQELNAITRHLQLLIGH